MPFALVTVVCAYLAFGAVANGAVVESTLSPVSAPDTEAVEDAQEAWSRGDWAKVRAVLEPIVQDSARLSDPRLREKGLCLLADATINDPELSDDERAERASSYLEVLFDADPDWRLPPSIYSPDLFELAAEVQDRRNQQTSIQCEADRNACQADLAAAQAEIAEVTQRYLTLERRFLDQEIEVVNVVARSRVFASIPFGFGHFYNGEPILGGVFLGVDAALGITGLGLILYRIIPDGCRREQGFQSGSLKCRNSNLAGVVLRRQVEEGIGWAFWGALALDVILAQARFKPFKTIKTGRFTRQELDADREPSRRRNRTPRAKVRPTGAIDRHRAGLGVSVRF